MTLVVWATDSPQDPSRSRLWHPFWGHPPGTDTRGMGLESFDGRGPVRKSKGATRPPTIPPAVWGKASPKIQAAAINTYVEQLAVRRPVA